MKNFLLNFKLLLFSLLFAFTMGEILVRYSDKIEDLLIQFNLKLSDKVTALRIPDGYLHHTLRPNVSALSVWGTRKIIYHTNSLGYRDIKQRKISKKTKSQERILFLGDSFAESVGINYEDSFIFKLESLFNENGKNLEILNAGVVSLSPSLEYRKLKQFFDVGFITDKVVLMVDISDVHDEGVVYLNWEKRDKHSLANQTPETISLLTYSAGLYQVGSSQGKKEEKTFLRIKLFHFLQDRLRHLFFADDKESINQIPGDNEEWLTLSPRSKWTESDNLYQTWGKKGVERVKKYILKISELCRKHNTNFSFVIYPWPTQLQSKRRPSKQQEVFSEFALANDLVFYDLYQDFFILDNWRSYFIYADNHWNEKGHYFIANLLYEKLSPKNTEIQNTL